MPSERTRRRVLRSAALAAGIGLAGCAESQSAGDGPTANGTATTSGTDAPSGTETTDATGDGPDRPVTGDEVPELVPLDEAVLGFATEREVPAAAAAVARDGEVVHQRGYGWRDADRTEEPCRRTRASAWRASRRR